MGLAQQVAVGSGWQLLAAAGWMLLAAVGLGRVSRVLAEREEEVERGWVSLMMGGWERENMAVAQGWAPLG